MDWLVDKIASWSWRKFFKNIKLGVARFGKFILDLFDDSDFPREERERFIRAVKKKEKRLAKYGGRIHVSNRGAIRDVFETDEGRNAYYREIISEFDEKVKRARDRS